MSINLSDLILDGSTASETANSESLVIDEAKGGTHQVTANVDAVSLGFEPDQIVDVVRSGNDIILTLANGEQIRLVNYFEFFEFGKGLSFVGLETAAAAAAGASTASIAGGVAGFAGGAAAIGAIAVGGGGGAAEDTSTDVPTVAALLGSDPTPILTGTAEAGATVEVTVGGATFAVQANGQGEWELNTETATPIEGSEPFTPLGDGEYEVGLTATDAAGNTATDDTSEELTIDTEAPVVAISPLMTGLNTVVSGTAEAGGGVVSIYDADDNLLGTAPVDENGHWTFTPETPLTEGAVITATQTDAAGNMGSASETLSYDTDGDGVANSVDIDDDGDGILDTVEGSDPNVIVFRDLIQPGNDTIVEGFTAPSNYERSVDLLSPSAGSRYFYATGSAARSGVADFEVPTETLSSGSNQFSIDVGTRNASSLPAEFTIALMSGSELVGELTGTPLAEPAVGWTPFTLDVELTEEQLAAGLTLRIDVPEQSTTGFVGFDNFTVAEFVGDDDDNDGIVNSLDTDSDNAGYGDNVEAQYDQDYIAPLLDEEGNPVDVDGDGLNDAYDQNTSGLNTVDGSVGLVPADTDADGTADYVDDNAGTPDSLPLTLNPLAIGVATTISGTGVVGATITLTIDGEEVDAGVVGADGTWSYTPEAPLSEATEVTALQSGAAHLPEATSSVTATLSPDTDDDGVANAVDIDDDNDGILDVNENTYVQDSGPLDRDTGTAAPITQLSPAIITVAEAGTVTFRLSSDSFSAGDGGFTLENAETLAVGDRAFAGNPRINEASPTVDIEVNLEPGVQYQASFFVGGGGATENINLEIIDSDVDVFVDTDGDGTINALDTDSDNGGLSDNVEVQYGEDYIAPLFDEEGRSIDSDGDGLNDAYDEAVGVAGSIGLVPVDVDDNGVVDAYEFDVAAGELPLTIDNAVTTSISGKGVPGALVEISTEEDGVIGTAEVQADGTWSFEVAQTEPLTIGDGETVTATQSHPDFEGATGVATADALLDTDGDGVANIVDIDDDNDGILDVNDVEYGELGEYEDLWSGYPGYSIRFSDDEEGFEGSLTENNVPEHVLSGSSISFGPDFGVQISDRPDQYGDAYQFDLGAVANTNVEDALAAGHYIDVAFTTAEQTGAELALSAIGTDLIGGFYGTFAVFVNGENVGEYRSIGHTSQSLIPDEPIQLLSGQENTIRYVMFNDTSVYNYVHGFTANIVRAEYEVIEDTDSDGTINALDTDSDNGGLSDNVEAQYNQTYVAPLFGEDGNPVDVDGDGLNDAYDEDLDGAEGSVGLVPADFDGDGLADFVDDNDNTPDTLPISINPTATGLETVISGTAVPGSIITLTQYGSALSVTPVEIVAGPDGTWSATPEEPITNLSLITATQVGTGEFEGMTSDATECVHIDTDADGVIDTVDIDDDNDGILDVDEAGEFGAFSALPGANPSLRHLYFDNNQDSDTLALEANNAASEIAGAAPGQYGPTLDVQNASSWQTVETSATQYASAEEALKNEVYLDFVVDVVDDPSRVIGISDFYTYFTPQNELDGFGGPSQQNFDGKLAIMVNGEVVADLDMSNPDVDAFFEGWNFDTAPIGSGGEATVRLIPYGGTNTSDLVAFNAYSFGLETAPVIVSNDADGDGIINSRDTDSDGGGVNDILENGGVDADGDGMLDALAATEVDGQSLDGYHVIHQEAFVSNEEILANGPPSSWYDVSSINDAGAWGEILFDTGTLSLPSGNLSLITPELNNAAGDAGKTLIVTATNETTGAVTTGTLLLTDSSNGAQDIEFDDVLAFTTGDNLSFSFASDAELTSVQLQGGYGPSEGWDRGFSFGEQPPTTHIPDLGITVAQDHTVQTYSNGSDTLMVQIDNMDPATASIIAAIPASWEASAPTSDADNNGTADYLETDNGSDIDTDDDGVYNHVDIDDDNDGILDVNESATLFANEYGGTFGVLEGTETVRDLESPVAGYTFTASNNAAGQYAVVDAQGADNFHGSLFGHLEDSSGDPDGAFLVINGGTTQGAFFSEQVTLTADTNYDFGFSAANGFTGGGNLFEIGMRIFDSNGELVENFSPGELEDSEWVQSSSAFNTGSETDFTIELYNISTQAAGNDFAVDDIFMRPTDGGVVSNDIDGDGIINALDTDSDNGGLDDNTEVQYGEDYIAPLFDEDGNPVDVDGDGLNDAYDEDLEGAEGSVGLTPNAAVYDYVPATGELPVSIDEALTSGLSGTGLPGATITISTDADGDLGTATVDEDGTWSFDIDPPADGEEPTVSVGETLTATQEHPDFEGATGVEVADALLDTDGDGVANIVDIDDDNDGILDVNDVEYGELGEYEDLWSGYPGYSIRFSDDEEGFEGSLTENNVPEHVLSGSSISFGPDFGVQISDRPDQYGDAYQFDLGAVANTNVEDALAAGHYIDVAFTTAEQTGAELALSAIGTDLIGGFYGDFAVFVNGENVGEYRSIGHTSQSLIPDEPIQLLSGQENTIRYVMFNDTSVYNYVHGFTANIVRAEYEVIEDTDSDGTINALDTDSDNGGLSDNVEAQYNQTYVAPLFDEDDNPVDVDGDGLNDAYDEDLEGAEGSVGLTPADTNDDGLADVYDDNGETPDELPLAIDAVFDGAEITGTGVVGATITLTDGTDTLGTAEVGEDGTWSVTLDDAIADGRDVTAVQSDAAHAPDETSTTTQVLVLDTDLDGVANTVDIDDDNDGILDVGEEMPMQTFTGTADGKTFNIEDGSITNTVSYTGHGGDFSANGTIGFVERRSGGIDEADKLFHTFAFEQPVNDLRLALNNLLGGSNMSHFTVTYSDGTTQEGITVNKTGDLRLSEGGLTVGGNTDSNQGNGWVTFNGLDPELGITSLSFQQVAGADTASRGATMRVEVAMYDADFDGVNNSVDTDSDNGGATDNVEAQHGQTLIAPLLDENGDHVDSDGDGLNDAYDNNLNGAENSLGLSAQDADDNGTADYFEAANASDVDTDGDGVHNHIDPDIDGDGLLNATEISVDASEAWFIETNAVIRDSRALYNNPVRTADGSVVRSAGLVFDMSDAGEPNPEFLYGLSVGEGQTVDTFNLLSAVGTQNDAYMVVGYDLQIFDANGAQVFSGSASGTTADNVLALSGFSLGEGAYTVSLQPTESAIPAAAEIAEVVFTNGAYNPANPYEDVQNVTTPPVGVDADADGAFNNVDIDSDGDGIWDQFEITTNQSQTVDLASDVSTLAFGLHQNNSGDYTDPSLTYDEQIALKYSLNLDAHAHPDRVPALNTDYFSPDLIGGELGAGLVDFSLSSTAFALDTQGSAHLNPFEDDHYVQLAFQMQDTFPAGTDALAMNSIRVNNATTHTTGVTIRISNDGFDTFTEVLTDTPMATATVVDFDTGMVLNAGETYELRLYYHGEWTTSQLHDDIAFGIQPFDPADPANVVTDNTLVADTDRDGDGVADRLEADSNGDGTSDREEVELDATELAALESGTANSDGFLILEDTAGLTLDFGNLTNVTDLEYVNMDGTTGQELTLSDVDLLSATPSGSLLIFGDEEDTVNATGFTDSGTTRDIGGAQVAVYDGLNGTELLVEEDVDVVI